MAFFVTAFGALQWTWDPNVKLQVVVYVVATVVLALVMAFGRKIVGMLGAVSVWWHTILGLVIIVALFAKPAHHNGASFVFFHFVNDSAFHWPFYAAMLGLLLGAETYTGYDACAHMSEETKQPGLAARRHGAGDRHRDHRRHPDDHRAVGWTAVGWVALADLLFILPATQPVTEWSNFPYTLPVFLVIVGGAALWWSTSAKKWFVGPRSLGTPEQLVAIERGLPGRRPTPRP